MVIDTFSRSDADHADKTSLMNSALSGAFWISTQLFLTKCNST